MSYPIIHQHDANNCGPACLAMVAASHGKPQSVAMLSEKAGTNRQGTTLAGLVRAAEHIGFAARGVRASNEVLLRIDLPAIAHWSEDSRNHFVVLYEFTDRRTTIGDPAEGLRELSPETFYEYWTGVLILLRPHHDRVRP